jgi:hypothetical protein
MDEPEGEQLVLLKGHPYFKQTASVWQRPNKQWTVRWRDFLTCKQDRDFDTRQQANAFASSLFRYPLVVTGEAEELANADRFWREL